MKVRDIMTHDVAAVLPGIRLDHAVRLMRDRDCGCLPVVNEEHEVVAMLTDRDVVLTALRTDRPLSGLSVASAMTGHAYICHPEDTVLDAERVMGLHQVRRLPVVDREGRLVGLLSIDDIAREALQEEGLIRPLVSPCAVGHTLGEITRPHLIETLPLRTARAARGRSPS